MEEDEKGTHTHNATLSLGLLWLNLSATFVIPASVAWHEAKQDLRTTQQNVQPAGRMSDKVLSAHLVWKVSPLTWELCLCLLLLSPAQILQTIGSEIMKQ